MLFVVDVGNTNMEFGVYEQGKLCQSFRLVTRRDITSDEVGPSDPHLLFHSRPAP